ncbi:hypothetical protein ACNVED_10215 [Legionella sp. D16C41]|uniref:hypothetical protein n=1 Tax=Legionella sp. D16C41 TaxID=3402688 RepID=UPI003AF7323F
MSFKLIVICSDSRVADRACKEIWRQELRDLPNCEIMQIDQKKQWVPLLDKTDAQDTQVLLITGEHGSLNTRMFNEVSLYTWQNWVRINKKNVQFDLIITDLCDSTTLLAIGMASLLKTSGMFISAISTCHGMRSAIIAAKPRCLSDIQNALKNYIDNTSILGGTNISFAKRKIAPFPRSLFFSEYIKEIHDKRVPMALNINISEEEQRQKVIKLIKSKGISSKESECLERYINSEKVLKELYSNQLNWLKVGVWGSSFLIFAGLVKLYAMLYAMADSLEISYINDFTFK